MLWEINYISWLFFHKVLYVLDNSKHYNPQYFADCCWIHVCTLYTPNNACFLIYSMTSIKYVKLLLSIILERYSRTLMAQTAMTRTLWMSQTNFVVPWLRIIAVFHIQRCKIHVGYSTRGVTFSVRQEAWRVSAY